MFPIHYRSSQSSQHRQTQADHLQRGKAQKGSNCSNGSVSGLTLLHFETTMVYTPHLSSFEPMMIQCQVIVPFHNRCSYFLSASIMLLAMLRASVYQYTLFWESGLAMSHTTWRRLAKGLICCGGTYSTNTLSWVPAQTAMPEGQNTMGMCRILLWHSTRTACPLTVLCLSSGDKEAFCRVKWWWRSRLLKFLTREFRENDFPRLIPRTKLLLRDSFVMVVSSTNTLSWFLL